jgi:hypothetical protein
MPTGLLQENYAQELFVSPYINAAPVSAQVVTQVDISYPASYYPLEGIGNTSPRTCVFTGFISAPSTENFYFELQADDGAELWINGVNLGGYMAFPKANATYGPYGPVAFVLGTPLPIQIIWHGDGVNDTCILSWSNTELGFVVVPTSAFTYAFTLLSATPGYNYITLDWGIPEDSYTDFQVFRLDSSNPDLGFQLLATVASGTYTYVDYSVSAGVTYTYYIVPVGDLAEGLTNQVSATMTAGAYNMSRATVYQTNQIVAEATPGTLPSSPSFRRLHSIKIDSTPDRKVKVAKFPGLKPASDTQIGRGHTQHKYSAALDYNLLAYIFTSMFGPATITTPADATNARQWAWTVSPLAPLTPQSYAFEQGSSRGAERYLYSVFTDADIKFNDTDASLDGSLFSQLPIRDITLSTGASEVTSRAVNPQALGVYMSTVAGGASGFTALSKNMGVELNLNGLWKPVFHSSDITTTYDDVVEIQPQFSATLTEEETGASEVTSLINILEANQLVYLGIQSKGAIIDAAGTGTPIPLVSAIQYSLQIQMPAFVTKEAPKDDGGVWSNSITFENGYDNTFGMVKITLINSLTAL